MRHHVPYLARIFDEVHSIFKPGGRLLIQDLNCSLLLRIMLHMMRIEGYSFDVDVDVFDPVTPANDPRDLGSGNNAIPNLVLDDPLRFHRNVPGFHIAKQGFSEVFVYLASGGVTSKTFFIPLPNWFLQALKLVNDSLARLIPPTPRPPTSRCSDQAVGADYPPANKRHPNFSYSRH